MKKNSSASLVIPLYNNDKTLAKLLKRCNTILNSVCSQYEIIVCDDKSTDSSAYLLKENFRSNPKFKLIFHKKNKGIAKTIYELYKKAEYPYIILFSVDGDWNPEDIKKLLMEAVKYRADIVIGKRAYQGYTLYRKIISFLYNFLPYLFFGVKTIDAGSIKVIKKNLIKTTPIISKSVFFEAELIIKASQKGSKIISIPINFKRQTNKKSGGGKIILVVNSMLDLIRLRLSLKSF